MWFPHPLRQSLRSLYAIVIDQGQVQAYTRNSPLKPPSSTNSFASTLELCPAVAGLVGVLFPIYTFLCVLLPLPIPSLRFRAAIIAHFLLISTMMFALTVHVLPYRISKHWIRLAVNFLNHY